MQKRFSNVTDVYGNVVPGGTVTVTTYPGGSTALIYRTDDATGTAISSGRLTTDSKGYYEYYAPNGHYSETYSGTGIDTYTVSDIQLITDETSALIQLASTSSTTLGDYLVGHKGTTTNEEATTVGAYLNLQVKGLKKSFGLAMDGVTDDYTKFMNAVTSGKIIEAEEGTFALGTSPVFNLNYFKLYGAGIQKTIFKRIGSAGSFFQVKSAGGVDSTKFGIDFRDFTIDGNSIADDNLYCYDIAHLLLRNIESKTATRWGLNLEMCVSPNVYDSKFSSNVRGARIGSALKAAVEYLTNEANFYGCKFNSNTQEGISLDRALMAKFFGGDCSANANGILLLGSRRCLVHGMWIENNTTDAINTATSASPTVLNCDDNEFLENNVSGTGNVTLNNGTKNVISGYIAGNLVIGAITNTTILPNTLVVGTYTDGGTTTSDERRVGNRRLGSAVTNVHTIIGDTSISGDGAALAVTSTATGVSTFTGPANMNVTFTDGTGIGKIQLLSNLTYMGSQSNHSMVLITNNSERVRIDTSGNFGLGQTTFGSSATKTLALASGTAPTTGPADSVQIYSSDNSAGNTIPSFFCEGTEVLATGQADSVSSVRVKMRINGTVVTLLAI